MTAIVISDRALLQWAAYEAPFDLEHLRELAMLEFNLKQGRAQGLRITKLSDAGVLKWFEQRGHSFDQFRTWIANSEAVRRAVRLHMPITLVRGVLFDIEYRAPRGLSGIMGLFETAILVRALAPPAPKQPEPARLELLA